MFKILAAFLGRVVHEPEEIDPILRMLDEFLRDQLTHVACADNDRVLEVADVLATVRARRGAAGGDEHNGCSPKDCNLPRGGMRYVGQVRAEPEDECAYRDQMEDSA